MYIEKIKSPADLKKLDWKELQVVADETRQAVLNRVCFSHICCLTLA